MSTRSAIVRSTGPDMFTGRYIHFDGYPSGSGRRLWNLYHGLFDRDLNLMLKSLIDEHPAGWRSVDDFPDGCYCHGVGKDSGVTVTETNAKQMWCDYVYAFDDTEYDQRTMRIMVAAEVNWRKPRWQTLALINLDGPEPDWTAIERPLKNHAQ